MIFRIAGIAHITGENVAESWLSDDQASPFNVGGTGPVLRNEVFQFG